MWSAENTWKELADAGVDTAVISFGALEQHGHHLPLGTDWMLAEENARRLARELNAYVLPAMPFGCSREHMAFPGTISLRPSTLAAVLEDIVDSLRVHGFRTIVLFSSHGGNWILKPTMRELNFRYPELTIVWAGGAIPERGDAVPEDIHAGRGETSAILAVRPDLVKPVGPEHDSPGIVGQEFNDYLGYEATTLHGAWGNPSAATAEEGKAAMERAVSRQAEYVRWVVPRIRALRKGNASEQGGDA
jgi:creatinine amidohydrolase